MRLEIWGFVNGLLANCGWRRQLAAAGTGPRALVLTANTKHHAPVVARAAEGGALHGVGHLQGGALRRLDRKDGVLRGVQHTREVLSKVRRISNLWRERQQAASFVPASTLYATFELPAAGASRLQKLAGPPPHLREAGQAGDVCVRHVEVRLVGGVLRHAAQRVDDARDLSVQLCLLILRA